MRDANASLAAFGLAALVGLAVIPAAAQEKHAMPMENQTGGIDTVTLPSAESPIVSLRLMFAVGSIHDPAGKEGLAALTGLMVGDAGTKKHAYADILAALYPMAASISTNTDREVTVFSTDIHRDQLAEFTALLEEELLQPAFAASDFERNREQLLAYLTTTLRSGDDERLGLEAIQDAVFAGHPYGHPAEGTVEGLKSLTLDDVKAFYKQHYTRANLMLGVAGGYPASYPAKLAADLGALPAGTRGRMKLPAPPQLKGRHFELIAKQADSTGIHFGFPLPVNRADSDYFPLMVVNSFLGEHRTSFGLLMRELRGERGFNYGDYSYIEYWANPPGTNYPKPNVPRRQQFFSVWLRPVVPANAQFALRAALYEVGRIHDQGLTQDEFETTRGFLLNYTKLWVQRQTNRLAFHMDSRFYGTPYYIDEIEKRLKTLTLAEVNAAARKYLSTENFAAVLVAGNADELAAALKQDAPSPMKYGNPVTAAVLETDKSIEGLKVRPAEVTIVPVEEVFEK